MAFTSILCILICLSSRLLLSFTSAANQQSTTATAINIPLSPVLKTQSNDLRETVSHIVKSTLARAHHLKSPKTSGAHPFSSKVPLYALSVFYSIVLSFGNPPQSMPLVMDTGSSLLWVPCTSRYVCENCNTTLLNSTGMPTFKPELSSSKKVLTCEDPKCGWLSGREGKGGCPSCAYIISYAKGSTTGNLLSETLNFPEKVFTDFAVGCSKYSKDASPLGIAGFGRGPASLPSQLKLKKFSYCLLSHKFDDKQKSSNLILNGNVDGGDNVSSGVSYTRFRKNPSIFPFSDFYYLTVHKLTVGGQHVKIPHKYLIPSSNGTGGTIVDSGSTLTYMDFPIYEPVVREFERQTYQYKRAEDVEVQSGLAPCYNVTDKMIATFPELEFHFKGGAKIGLPLVFYFSVDGGPGALCMILVVGSSSGDGAVGGPAIILGNHQMQNYYTEYDLDNQRFGFKRQKCD